MSLAGFEPTIPAGEQPQTYALDRAATGTGCLITEGAYFIKQVGYGRAHGLLSVLTLLTFFIHSSVVNEQL